jgi:hypothetical protein
MPIRRARSLAFGLMLVFSVLLAGWAAGRLVGLLRVRASVATRQSQLDDYLKRNLQGIAEGQLFPDVMVRSVTTGKLAWVHPLLPEGGVVLFVAPECGSCAASVRDFQYAVDQLGPKAKPAIIVTGALADSLLIRVQDQQVRIPIYADMRETLRDDFHVTLSPVYFCLDADGRILRLGTASGPEKYMSILKPMMSK